jgi:hypothetical protein
MGRPPIDSEAVNVRMERALLEAIDRWIAQQPEPKPARPEAVRRLLQMLVPHPPADTKAVRSFFVQIVHNRIVQTEDGDTGMLSEMLPRAYSTIELAEEAGQQEVSRRRKLGQYIHYNTYDQDGPVDHKGRKIRRP